MALGVLAAFSLRGGEACCDHVNIAIPLSLLIFKLSPTILCESKVSPRRSDLARFGCRGNPAGQLEAGEQRIERTGLDLSHPSFVEAHDERVSV